MELFEEIRRGYTAGETIRQWAEKHSVHRRMVRQALAGAVPPERKKAKRAHSTQIHHSRKALRSVDGTYLGRLPR